jgi:hypothetical protein
VQNGVGFNTDGKKAILLDQRRWLGNQKAFFVFWRIETEALRVSHHELVSHA